MFRSDILCSITTLRFEILLVPNKLILHLFTHLEEGPSSVTVPALIKCKIPATVIRCTSNSTPNLVSTNSTRINIRPNARFQFRIVEMQIRVVRQ